MMFVINILFISECVLPILIAKMFHNFWAKFENQGHSAPFRKKTDCSAEGETIHISLLIPKRHTTYVTFKILVIIIRKFVKLKK